MLSKEWRFANFWSLMFWAAGVGSIGDLGGDFYQYQNGKLYGADFAVSVVVGVLFFIIFISLHAFCERRGDRTAASPDARLA